jgi:hypothetical protein
MLTDLLRDDTIRASCYCGCHFGEEERFGYLNSQPERRQKGLGITTQSFGVVCFSMRLCPTVDRHLGVGVSQGFDTSWCLSVANCANPHSVRDFLGVHRAIVAFVWLRDSFEIYYKIRFIGLKLIIIGDMPTL